MPDVALLGKSDFDWKVFLAVAPEYLGYNPATAIDKCPRKLSEQAKITAALSTFRSFSDNAIEAIRESRAVQNHQHYSFLVYAKLDTMLELHHLNAGLNLTTNSVIKDDGALFIVSALLDDWVKAVIAGCEKDVSKDLRILFDKVYVIFETIGLAELWSKYSRKGAADKTFYLEHKR